MGRRMGRLMYSPPFRLFNVRAPTSFIELPEQVGNGDLVGVANNVEELFRNPRWLGGVGIWQCQKLSRKLHGDISTEWEGRQGRTALEGVNGKRKYVRE